MTTRERWLVTGLLLAFWGAVFLAGLPASSGLVPGVDDTYFTDPAIQLATTGKIQAPVLEGLLAPWHTLDFHLFVPFYIYLLGGWLAVFGVGTASILGCYAACYALSSLLLWRLLRGFGLGLGTCLLCLASFAPSLLAWGLRPEPFALPFLLGGLILLETGGRGRLFLGLLATGTAAGCAVNLLPAAVALSLAMLAGRNRGERPGLGEIAAWGIAAFLAFALLFAVSIRFRFHDFLAQYLPEISARRGGNPLRFLSVLFRDWMPLLCLPTFVGTALVALLCLGQKGRMPERVRWLVWGCGATVVLGLLYRPSVPVLNMFFGWTAIFAFLGTAAWPVRGRIAATAGAAGFLVLSQALAIACVVGQRPVDRAACAQVRAALRDYPGRLIVDDYATRYVFDFRLPPGTRDIGYLHPLPDFSPTAADKRPGEAWVCSPQTLALFAPGLLETPPPPLRAFGHTFHLPQDPARVQIVW